MTRENNIEHNIPKVATKEHQQIFRLQFNIERLSWFSFRMELSTEWNVSRWKKNIQSTMKFMSRETIKQWTRLLLWRTGEQKESKPKNMAKN